MGPSFHSAGHAEVSFRISHLVTTIGHHPVFTFLGAPSTIKPFKQGDLDSATNSDTHLNWHEFSDKNLICRKTY